MPGTPNARSHTAMTLTFDERYRIIDSRDARWDGQFVTAVRSTKIYCRPSCPARTPKPQNVTFYPTSAAAHEAGYRACKRCLPEATPGTPDWDTRKDTVGRAMRLIQDGVVDRDGVPALAARLGYTPRHLNRILYAELGAGPLALARAQRAHTARMLLTGTDLPVADIAFASGFGSLRQCNDTMLEVFGLQPSAIRRAKQSAAGTPGTIDLALPVREPFDFAGVLEWMRARALGGLETVTETGFSRTIRLPGGPGWFEVRGTQTARCGAETASPPLRLRALLTSLADLGPLVARVRRLFDLDADPLAIDTALSSRPELRPLVAAIPGIRVPGAADTHEMLVRAMIGQQISVPAARTALERLVQALGDELPEVRCDDRLLFPTMSVIADRGSSVIRGPAARVRAIVGAAEALASGDLVLSAGDDAAEQRAALLAMPGIGPWTADYVRMRVLNDPDVMLPGDLVVRQGAERAGMLASAGESSAARELSAWAEGSAPWRSYLTAHLWRASMAPANASRVKRKKVT